MNKQVKPSSLKASHPSSIGPDDVLPKLRQQTEDRASASPAQARYSRGEPGPGEASTTSRVAHLVAEYERWHELYEQVGDLEDALPKDAKEEEVRLNTATKQAVRRMHETMDELMVTPARTLHDFGLKARVVREFQHYEWYSDDAKLDRGELMARAMVIELMEINTLPPIRKRDVTPTELLPSYVEPPAIPLPNTAVRHATHGDPSCLAAALGLQFGRAVEDHNELDRPGANERPVAQLAFLSDAMETLQESISFTQAISPLGALAHLLMVCGDLNVIDEVVPQHSEQEERVKRAHRCLWSLRHFLETHFSLDARVLGSEYHMPCRLDMIPRTSGFSRAISSDA